MRELDATNTYEIALSLGGNIGDTAAYFRHALEILTEKGFVVDRVSGEFRNPAVGCEEGAADFVNIAVTGKWAGTPQKLLQICQGAEVACGRPAEHPHWHSRTVDIDIIYCNGICCNTDDLTLPHPLWKQREFVLRPMLEIMPDAVQMIEETMTTANVNN